MLLMTNNRLTTKNESKKFILFIHEAFSQPNENKKKNMAEIASQSKSL